MKHRPPIAERPARDGKRSSAAKHRTRTRRQARTLKSRRVA